MDYKNIYEKLISYCRKTSIFDRLKCRNPSDSRLRENLIYTEIHHIIPKSMGEDDSQENLVRLLPEEHMLCHLLLFKIHRNSKMYCAMALMAGRENNHTTRTGCIRKYRNLRESIYREYRKEYHPMFGKTHSAEAKRKISEAAKGKVVVKDTTGKISKVSVNDRRFIDGELVHHTKGRKQSTAERAEAAKRNAGAGNPNASSITDAEILLEAVKFHTVRGYISVGEWKEHCKSIGYPYTYGSHRFGGQGFAGLIDKLREKIGKVDLRDRSKRSPRQGKILSEKTKGSKWYHDPKTGKGYQMMDNDPRIEKLNLVRGRPNAKN